MDITEIISQLGTLGLGRFPIAAIEAARANRAAVVPSFLEVIEACRAPDATRQTLDTGFFIFHLLGEWREKWAYRSLARLLRCPGYELDALLGDAITTTIHRVMAAVFDGDPQPICDIVLDPQADEFVRSRMCETLAILVLRGELDSSLVTRFLRDAYSKLQPQAECYVWQGWQSAIAMLGLRELETLVRRAFARGFINRHWLGFENFRRDLQSAIKEPGEPQQPGDDKFTLFGNTVEELSGWFGLSRDYRAGRQTKRE